MNRRSHLMATPAIQSRVSTMGAMPGVQNAAGFTRVIEAETRRWAPKAGAAATAAATTATTASTATAHKP